MVSKKPFDASKSKKSHGGQGSDVLATLTDRINQLKKQILADRVLSVEEKVEKNRKKLETQVSYTASLAASRKDIATVEDNSSGNMLSRRMEGPLCRVSGFVEESGERDCVNGEEVVSPTTSKLPLIDKIPPYTTWIFLNRNQRMAEDQSVVGRRRIYYDKRGSEALICSDSEEEIGEVEQARHKFSEGEDRIMRMVIQDFELSEEVLTILIQFVRGTTSEIQERCNLLKEKNDDRQDENLKMSEACGSVGGTSPGKSLSSALGSFDNLFCRRCLVFDCRLHGCSQTLVYPTERKSYSSDSEDDGKPCSDHCYLQLQVTEGLTESLDMDMALVSESKSLDQAGPILSSANPQGSDYHDGILGKRTSSEPTVTIPNSKTGPDGTQVSCSKKLKLSVSDLIDTEDNLNHSSASMGRGEALAKSNGSVAHTITEDSTNVVCENAMDKFSSNLSGSKTEDNIRDEGEGLTEVSDSNQELGSKRIPERELCSRWDWKPLERELYLKGIEIFGRNSCLIARNLLSGMKTCIEVSSYMNDGGAAVARRPSVNPYSYSDDYGRTDIDHMDADLRRRARLLRKRGRSRKLKYSSKAAGHPLIWRRIADGKNRSCKQYTPCGCQSMCGKQCPCLLNGTCCEKYCGCLKTCKNRFRGCHCAKSQCRSRQCPCFAAGRECDPDVCRNCWVSCGDGSLGEPPRQGDSQCGNMRLLLRQQQRILLAKSDVAGWGAFLKNPVNRNDYLGEYTGELISHREADKRGKIYDRANSSFLFDLNDQYVLDAYRKGDKLKFANHSSDPNCYAKVMLVAGDHRVGIFAKERIEAGEEIFYDYRYGPEQAPIWARKPDDSKRDDSPTPQVRARKHQSH